MGKFLNGQVLEWPQAPGTGAVRRGRGPPLDWRAAQRPGPGAGAMSKNLPMKEFAHEQELAHSLTCRGGVGWVGGGS